MSLQVQLDQDLKTALKNHESARVSVLRMLKSAISYKQIDKGSPLNEQEIIAVMEKEAKNRKESITAFTGIRNDLAGKEQQELEIIESYLPAGLSDVEINQIIDQTLGSMDTDRIPSDRFGQLMGAIMGRLKGHRVDGNRVKQLLQQKLN